MDATDSRREVNVLLELCMRAPMSFEVLDANSDAVLGAVHEHAANTVLGPTVTLRMSDCAILLRFDMLTESEADAYRQLAQVIETIEAHAGLTVEHSRSAVGVPTSPDTRPVRC